MQFTGLHAEALTVKAKSIGSNQANCFTLHNPHNQDISQMTFSFVVMCGPFFVLNAHRDGVDLRRMVHKRLNSGITTKHFTNDLEPYQDNDSRGGRIDV